MDKIVAWIVSGVVAILGLITTGSPLCLVALCFPLAIYERD